MFFCAAGSFAIFSAIFSYLPFRLYDAPMPCMSFFIISVVGLGISAAGFIYREAGWTAVIFFSLLLQLIPLASGFGKRKNA